VVQLGFNVARISIDDEAWTRFEALADLLQWEEERVAAKMITLWKKTQDLELVEVDRRQLCRFLKISNDVDLSTFVTGACEVGLFRRHSRSKFEIVGNSKHISNKKVYRNSGQIGGQTRAANAKRSENGKFQPVEKIEDVTKQTLQGSSKGVTSPIQFNSIQFNALHSNSSVCVGNDDTHPHEVLDFDFSFGREWKKFAQARKSAISEKPDSYFADRIAFTRSQMGFGELQMQSLLSGIAGSKYWAQKLTDPDKLFDVCKDGLRKIDHVIADIEAARESVKL
jgi:hypothetical protein